MQKANNNSEVVISVVSPVYRAELIVEELVEQIELSLSKLNLPFEIILVEDHSPDNSWDIIESICENDSKVIGLKLSRNFGQHYAITAGLDKAKGDWIVVMDCDLQDNPLEIPKMLELTGSGYDIVYAKRQNRKDGFFKRMSSKWFYKVFSYMTDTNQNPEVANYGVYSRNVINSILSMKDHIRYFPTMSQWVGFKSTYHNVEHGSRHEGESSYSWSKLFKLAFDNIISFSDKPLRLVVRTGIIISIVSFLFGLYYIIRYFQGHIEVVGYASMIVSIWFLSGIIIFTLGVIGLYLAKTFDRVKNRPTYIIEKELNSK